MLPTINREHDFFLVFRKISLKKRLPCVKSKLQLISQLSPLVLLSPMPLLLFLSTAFISKQAVMNEIANTTGIAVTAVPH